MEKLKVLIITQARLGSSRFPNKVTSNLAGSTLLGVHLERLKKSKMIDFFCVATTNEKGVEEIIRISENAGFESFQGSLDDVLDRFYKASLVFRPDIVVRVTSDCPLIDPILIDSVVDLLIESNSDYASNILLEEFPDGQDVEAFTFSTLEKAHNSAYLKSDREHVTSYIRNNSNSKGDSLFKSINLPSPENFGHVRMTVDEPSDLQAINILISHLGIVASWLDYTNFIIEHSQKFDNQSIIRNEGYQKSLSLD